jgi:hypothetical protein
MKRRDGRDIRAAIVLWNQSTDINTEAFRSEIIFDSKATNGNSLQGASSPDISTQKQTDTPGIDRPESRPIQHIQT